MRPTSEGLEKIANLLADALTELGADPARDPQFRVRSALLQAQTIAAIHAAKHRRDEARTAFAALSHLEHRTLQ